MVKFVAQVVSGLLVGVALSACAETEEATSEIASDLLVSQWSAPSLTMSAYRSAQAATLNGTTYLVSSGYCGAWSCGGADEANELFWSKLTPTGRTTGVWMPNHHSAHKVSLAAFNGFLYMVHTGVSDTSSTWIARFDPATELWSPNYQIPYPSFAGPPAIAAFNGKLYFVGTTPGTYQMWMGTMTTGEVFSTSVPVPGHDSASRPSVAVFHGWLYVAHRHGQTGEIVVGSYDGASWKPPQYVQAGPAGAPIRGVEPVIAAHNGFLHLIHRRPESNYVWWTYFDGCKWPAEVSLNSLQTSYGPSLTQGGPGLILVTAQDDTWNGIIETRLVHLSKFTHAALPFPMPPTTCGVISQ